VEQSTKAVKPVKKRMTRSVFDCICLLLIVLLLTISAAWAQQAANLPRIGYLAFGPLSVNRARVEAFGLGLRELGYVDGKNIVLEYRYAEGKVDSLRQLAAELVRLKVDVMVTGGPTTTRAAKEATLTIPIVMGFDNDPVGNGFVASLARPGRNITGFASLAPEISGKQLELLKEIVPRLSRVAVFGNSTNPGNAQAFREAELAAGAFGLQLRYIDVKASEQIEIAFRAANKERAEAILALNSPVLNSNRIHVAELAVKSRLPAVYAQSEYVEDGGLMVYGVSYPDLFRRAAAYVHKILKGAKPADLPVEQPTKFEFVINLKTAKQMGLTIPPSVLARADRVIR
jgi:putative ABC transport system substrate-binding protein